VLRIHERRLRNGSDCVSLRLIHISDIRIARIVIDVVNRDVIDGRIADVDAIHIFAAGSIRGHIHFSRAQRKPAHISAATAN